MRKHNKKRKNTKQRKIHIQFVKFDLNNNCKKKFLILNAKEIKICSCL